MDFFQDAEVLSTTSGSDLNLYVQSLKIFIFVKELKGQKYANERNVLNFFTSIILHRWLLRSTYYP
jgi:hypothetical protein